MSAKSKAQEDARREGILNAIRQQMTAAQKLSDPAEKLLALQAINTDIVKHIAEILPAMKKDVRSVFGGIIGGVGLGGVSAALLASFFPPAAPVGVLMILGGSAKALTARHASRLITSPYFQELLEKG